MIKANELRLGNWVKYTGLSVTTENKIEEIYGLGVLLSETHWSVSFRALEPIPLTPEILEQIAVEIKPYTYWKEGYDMENKLYSFASNDFKFMDRHCVFYIKYKNGEIEFNYIVGGIYYQAQHFEDDLMVDGAFTVVKLNYIHQLQNLYFALTGEELQVNIHDNSHSPEIPK